MLFSILIINYNHEDLVSRCIESALNQTYRDIEVICVDDASTDNSAEIIKGYKKDRRFKFIRNKKNKNCVQSRGIGIKAARGEYILFLDSDDTLEPDACEIISETLCKQKYDIVGFDTNVQYDRFISDNEKENFEKYLSPVIGKGPIKDIIDKIYIDNSHTPVLWIRCYRTKILKRAVYKYLSKESIGISEDYYQNFIYMHLIRSYYGIKDKLYNYSFGNGMTTGGKKSPESIKRDINSCYYAHKGCRAFSKKKGILYEYGDAFEKHENVILAVRFLNALQLQEEDKKKVLSSLFEKYDLERIIRALKEQNISIEKISEEVNITTLREMANEIHNSLSPEGELQRLHNNKKYKLFVYYPWLAKHFLYLWKNEGFSAFKEEFTGRYNARKARNRS